MRDVIKELCFYVCNIRSAEYCQNEENKVLNFMILIPSPKEALCQVWLKMVQLFLRISSIFFSLFRNYLPLEKGGAIYLNKLESPSLKDALCQVWLKLRRFLNFLNVFSLLQNYLPLTKGETLHLNKHESQSPKDALC